MTAGGGPDPSEDGGDPLGIPHTVGSGLEPGNQGDLALARGDQPHQDPVDPVDPGPANRQFRGAHGPAPAPTGQAPAAPCR